MACALVVLVHVNLYARPGMAAWWPAAHWLAPIYGLSVPTFFLLSGYHATRPGSVLDAAAVRRRLGRLMPAYLVWTAVMLALDVPAGLSGGERVLVALTGPWQLYYLLALGQVLVIAAWVEPRRGLWGLAAVSVGIYAASSVLLWTVGIPEAEYWLVRVGATWGVHFVIGAALRRSPAMVALLHHWWPAAAVAAVPALGLYAFGFLREETAFGDTPRMQIMATALPFQVLGSLALVGAASAGRERRWVAALAALAPDTFGIYLCHTTILVYLYDFLTDHRWTTVFPVEVPLVGGAVSVLATVLVRLGRRVLPARVAGVVGFGG